MDNETLKEVFRDLHSTITTAINPDSIIDVLLSKNIICEDDYYVLRNVPDSRSRCRDLFALLYRSLHPETFIQLRLALLDQYPWIVDDIDEQLASATAQLHLSDSADDIRNALQRTCPVCYNLFAASSQLVDRRPFVACVTGDTLCANCCNECCKRPDGKCPTCGDDLLPTPTVNKALLGLIEKCLLEIPVKDIEMEMEPFARGAFGKVYKAKWRKENVVIKVIKACSEEEKQAVKYEASLTLRLNHPNVIKLFGITCVKRKKHGIVMEEAEHGSLNNWIGKIDHEKLAKIALGIVAGLEYVHSQKVIHRDIKPQNILMFGPKDDMVPKIADFGVSKVIQTVMTLTKVGQELYMAPEVRMNLRYGFTADIYSLSMMLFEMFNEQLIAESSREVNHFIISVHNGRIDEIPKSCKVPAYLRNVIERGWKGKPEERAPLSEYYSALRGEKSVSHGASSRDAQAARATSQQQQQDDARETFRPSSVTSGSSPLFRPSALLSHTFEVGRRVQGVTQLHGVVYILCEGFSTISRFNARTHQRLTEIVVRGLRSPYDIVACERTSQVYVADNFEFIWRVSSDGAVIKRWLPKSPSDTFTPRSLSVTSTRLLVTSRDTRQLIQFDEVGDELRRVQLPDDMTPYHAVESPTATFIVSRYNEQLKQGDVSEVSTGGEVLRQFSGSHPSSLGFTPHVAVDSHGNILVADADSSRIMLLDAHLTFLRVIIDKHQFSDKWPRRLCYIEQSGQLLVAFDDVVAMFDVLVVE